MIFILVSSVPRPAHLAPSRFSVDTLWVKDCFRDCVHRLRGRPRVSSIPSGMSDTDVRAGVLLLRNLDKICL